MALINRVSQLFRADFNAVLDRIEEPEQLLKQAVRDMEDELAASERRVAACLREQEILEMRRKEVAASADELDAELDLCFDAGKDDLARGIVRRKLEARRLANRLNARLSENERFLEAERRQLEENSATLDGLRQKAELFVHSPPKKSEADSDSFARMSRDIRIAEDEVEIAFLREKSARGES